MPVFYHTDLQQKLFLLALLTPIILQFSQFCKTNCAHSISKTIKHALPLSKNLQNWPHYKTFSWREFSVIPGRFSRKNLFLCNKQDSNYGLLVKRIKNSQNHLYGQPDWLSLLSSTKCAVRTVGAVWMNINRVRLQHDRELIMLKF